MLKNILKFTIICFITISLTACGSSKTPSPSSTASQSKQTIETDKALQLVKDFAIKSKKADNNTNFVYYKKDALLYIVKAVDKNNKIVGWYGVDVPTQTVGAIQGDPTTMP